MANGLDISHWTEYNTGPIEGPEIEAMQRHNVERVAVSIAIQDIARRQIEAIHTALPYVEIQTYRYYYWQSQKQARLQDEQFIADCRRNLYNIQFHWIDIEDTGTIQPEAANIQDTNEIINFWAGKCLTGLYSAQWVWKILFPSGYDGFKYMPLWFADWDWGERLTLDPGQEFGGWTQGAMKQTYGDVNLDGVLLCDTNYFVKPEPVQPLPPNIPDLGALSAAVDGHWQNVSDFVNRVNNLVTDVAQIRALMAQIEGK